MPSARRILRFIGKTVGSLALLAILCIAVLLILIHHEHNTPLDLPAPTGHFAVGRTTYMWTNPAAIDELSPTPHQDREVMVWMWYPAVANTSAPAAPYVPAAWSSALAPRGIIGLLTRDSSVVHTHSTPDPAVASDEHSYPVVIMRAGGGAPTTDFTTLAEDLASHGYFVVGLDAPYRTYAFVMPDGRIVTRPPGNDPEDMSSEEADRLINKLLPMWTADVQFVVDQLQRLNATDPSGRFTGRLDMQRLGMFGHSFGGAQALQLCHDDARCKAGIDIDGAPYGTVVRDGLKQPFMFILSDHSREAADPASHQINENLQSIYRRLPNGRFFVTIRGANHFSFSDQILLKSHYMIGLLQLFGFGNLPPREGLAITTDYVHTFFDVYLKHAASASALQQLSAKYPEVQTETP